MLAKRKHLLAMAVLAAVALAGGLLVLVTVGEMAHATVSGTNGLIAFVSDRDSVDNTLNDDIYVMNPDGSNPTRLTSAPSVDQFPAVSSSGKEVAFLSNRDGARGIYVMDTKNDENDAAEDGYDEGDHLRKIPGSLTPTTSPISWSLDGKRIAFAVDLGGGNADIYVVPADGSEPPTKLTNHPKGDAQPRFSPNGQEILFSSNRESAVAGAFDIYKMKAEPESADNVPTRLTNHGADDRQPDFSPDGNRIVFTSTRDGDNDIYVMKAEPESTDNLPANLTNTGAPLNERYPAWSPDAKKIAFWSATGTGLGPSGPSSEIYEVDVQVADDGTVSASNPINLTYNPDHPEWGNIHPDWGPAVDKRK